VWSVCSEAHLCLAEELLHQRKAGEAIEIAQHLLQHEHTGAHDEDIRAEAHGIVTQVKEKLALFDEFLKILQ
jgi:hypothetical protein